MSLKNSNDIIGNGTRESATGTEEIKFTATRIFHTVSVFLIMAAA
jgi:hypothetical protein